MKFITEGDLRELYKKEPFTTYQLNSETRLTPGARQFLSDRGIYMFDNEMVNKYKNKKTKKTPQLQTANESWKELKLNSKLKSIEALFLLTAEELLSKDVSLAQSVVELSKQFSSLKNKGSVENLCCRHCSGINEGNFSENLDDCYGITPFHIHLEKGREIVILHRLRCALQEIEPLVLELYCSKDMEIQVDDLIGKMNQISNCISQLICSLIGVRKCPKQV